MFYGSHYITLRSEFTADGGVTCSVTPNTVGEYYNRIFGTCIKWKVLPNSRNVDIACKSTIHIIILQCNYFKCGLSYIPWNRKLISDRNKNRLQSLTQLNKAKPPIWNRSVHWGPKKFRQNTDGRTEWQMGGLKWIQYTCTNHSFTRETIFGYWSTFIKLERKFIKSLLSICSTVWKYKIYQDNNSSCVV